VDTAQASREPALPQQAGSTHLAATDSWLCRRLAGSVTSPFSAGSAHVQSRVTAGEALVPLDFVAMA